jgi:hypothetical protein
MPVFRNNRCFRTGLNVPIKFTRVHGCRQGLQGANQPLLRFSLYTDSAAWTKRSKIS